jgi:hypothetical protein
MINTPKKAIKSLKLIYLKFHSHHKLLMEQNLHINTIKIDEIFKRSSLNIEKISSIYVTVQQMCTLFHTSRR